MAHRTLTVARTHFRPYSDKGEIHMPCVTIHQTRKKTRQMMKPCSSSAQEKSIMSRAKLFHKTKYKTDVLRWYWLRDITANLEEDKKGTSFLVNTFRVVNIYRSKRHRIWASSIPAISNHRRLYPIEECPEQDVFISERKERANLKEAIQCYLVTISRKEQISNIHDIPSSKSNSKYTLLHYPSVSQRTCNSRIQKIRTRKERMGTDKPEEAKLTSGEG